MNRSEKSVNRFSVWAPDHERVDLVLEPSAERVAMLLDAGGWWQAEVADAGPGTRYRFSLDGGPPRPDPRSPWQPDGIDGPSAVVDHDAFGWGDRAWRGGPVPSAVLYELHVGTFTAAGHLRRGHRPARPPRRARRHRRRADAGGGVRRRAGLGLRRGAALGAPPCLRRTRGAQTSGRRGASPRYRGGPRRRLQPPRTGRQLPGRVRPLLHRPLSDAVGERGQLRRPRQRRGPALRDRQRLRLAASTTTSTACASTPYTPSSTRARCTSSRSWR